MNTDLTGKSQQTLGNGLAPVDGLIDRSGQLKELFLVMIAIVLHQILEEPGFLIDDGQGVVDFMGDACGQAADGGQLLSILKVSKGGFPAFIGILDTLYQLVGNPENNKSDPD